MFKNIGSILPKIIKRAGISQDVQDVEILNEFNKIKDKILSTDLGKKVRTMYAKNKVIAIASLSEEAVSELKNKENQIIKEINQKFNNIVLKKIKYII